MLSCPAAKNSRTSVGQAGPIDVPPPSQPTQGTVDFEEPECHPDVTSYMRPEPSINIIVIYHYRSMRLISRSLFVHVCNVNPWSGR